MIVIEITGTPKSEKDMIAELIHDFLRRNGYESVYTEPVSIKNKEKAV